MNERAFKGEGTRQGSIIFTEESDESDNRDNIDSIVEEYKNRENKHQRVLFSKKGVKQADNDKNHIEKLANDEILKPKKNRKKKKKKEDILRPAFNLLSIKITLIVLFIIILVARVSLYFYFLKQNSKMVSAIEAYPRLIDLFFELNVLQGSF